MHAYSPHNTLVFIHIPKAAGMTMRHVVARQFIGQPQYMFSIQNTYTVERFLELPEEQRAALRYVGGHLKYGLHRWIPAPVSYITMLRHPYDHLISYYHFFASKKRVKGRTFEEFIQQEHLHSYQLDYIVGYDDEPGEDGKWGSQRNRQLPTAAKLEIAERHLRQHFAAVGLVERFDESLLVMRQRLGWSNVHYIWKHYNTQRPRDAAQTAAYHALIDQYATPDLQLYRLAERLFDEHVAAYRGDLAADLERYRRRGRLYTRAYNLTRGIRESALYRKVRLRLRRP